VPLVEQLELTHGYRLTRTFGAPAGASHVFRIRQNPHSSYEVVIDSTSGDVWPGLTLQLLASDGVTVLQDSTPLGAQGYSRSLRFVNAGPTPVDDQLVRASTTSCPGGGCGPEDTYRIRVYDTTARLSRFNNSATQITLLLVQNTTGGLLNGTIYFWSSGGTLVGSQAFGLAARSTLVLNTASIPGVAGQGGTITIAHDGGYGVLSGKAVAVEPATGFTFDTPLTHRPR
jgi:hypothetical protein